MYYIIIPIKYFLLSQIEPNNKASCWDEELKFAVDSSLKGDDEKSLMTDCLNLLRNRLQNVIDTKPPSKKLNIKCRVFGLQSRAQYDHGLADVSPPK